MTKHYELARDPARPVEYFPALRIYAREQPNALTAAQIPILVAKMKELHPQHYGMVVVGFGIGARPSTLRPYTPGGPREIVLWAGPGPPRLAYNESGLVIEGGKYHGGERGIFD